MARNSDRGSARNTSAFGPNASAAGRDYHQIYNNFVHQDGRREIAIESDAFVQILRDGHNLQLERDALVAQLDDLSETVAAQGERLELYADAVPNSRYVQHLALAAVAALFVGAAIWAVVGPTKTSRSPGATSTTTVTAAADASSPQPRSDPAAAADASSRAALVAPMTMTCSAGGYFDRLATAPVGTYSGLLASAKVQEIRSRMKAYHVAEATTGLTTAGAACPSIVTKLDPASTIVWSGPFATLRKARAYCAAMHFDTAVNWDCYPLQVK